MDEALGTQAKLCGHLRDGARRSPALELCKRESDGRMPHLLPGWTCQEESFEDAHHGFWRLGRLELLAQAGGGPSSERRKINDLVGQFGGRHWQKRARAAWLEADAHGRHQSGRINDRKLRKGTVGQAAVKVLKLVGMLLVGNPKHVMAQIDHQGHPAIGKAAFPGVQWCVSFIETESLNIYRKGRRRTKAHQDSQDNPPLY